MTPGQKKKALAAITSMLGNIKTYFPNSEEDFISALSDHYPELHALAVAERIIKVPASLATRIDSTLRSLIRDCPPN
jgi:hypothetical protein